MALNTPELSVVAEYILSHHERWDGKGYPSGLKGENIPLLCRVLSVADAYDAMTNDRVYRKAISKEDAIAELKMNAGTQFDADIVGFFIKTVI
jgi:HD-GYP domain-containing protein (c-di-GMP phosphodiesterase class II)